MLMHMLMHMQHTANNKRSKLSTLDRRAIATAGRRIANSEPPSAKKVKKGKAVYSC